ncbi:YadA C-terminal domain-containing protein, partial [Cloacibacillus porcorum]
NRIEELDNDIRVAGAHAAALSAMHPIAYNPYEPTTISAGYGYYRSEQSFAVGVFHYIRENVLINAGVAFNSDGDTMGRAGVSFALGRSGRKQPSMIKDVSEMQKQMAAMQEMLMQLKEENKKNKEENRKNKEENRKNREIIKELKEALKEK